MKLAGTCTGWDFGKKSGVSFNMPSTNDCNLDIFCFLADFIHLNMALIIILSVINIINIFY
ncbi:hypothetical protein D7Y09_05740 [bacterium 1XD42-1]|nr:hypothetical protein D7X25_03970 [bacterium 1XD42-8]RKJ65561.1 hypothetical protein D7Y09_05740 [bacterium 1XD42-1]